MGDIGTAAPIPDWLKKAWAGARQRGVDTLTQDEIDAECAATIRPDITPRSVALGSVATQWTD